MGLKREEEAGTPADYDSWALLHSLLWPLEHATEIALELEREERPAPPVDPPDPLNVVREGGA